MKDFLKKEKDLRIELYELLKDKTVNKEKFVERKRDLEVRLDELKFKRKENAKMVRQILNVDLYFNRSKKEKKFKNLIYFQENKLNFLLNKFEDLRAKLKNLKNKKQKKEIFQNLRNLEKKMQ
jgi:hypothetical protein